MLQYCSHAIEGHLPCCSLGSSPIVVSYPPIALILDNKQIYFPLYFMKKKIQTSYNIFHITIQVFFSKTTHTLKGFSQVTTSF
jgi:hypothetical protein